jgi:hypothetical protein
VCSRYFIPELCVTLAPTIVRSVDKSNVNCIFLKNRTMWSGSVVPVDCRNSLSLDQLVSAIIVQDEALVQDLIEI